MGFLGSIRGAFQYVTKAVESVFTAAESFVQFRTGGGELGKDEFLGTFDKYAGYKEGWDKILAQPSFYTVSDKFAMPVPFDFEREHVMKMKVFGTNLETGKREERWVTVETSEEITRAEWIHEAKNASVSGKWLYETTIDYVAEFQYYIRE